jgi:hypothetical protein
MYEISQDEIIKVDEASTSVQIAKIGMHHTWLVHLHASYSGGTLVVECRYPIIDGTEWQGGIIKTENRDLLLQVDDSEPMEIGLSNGVTSVPLEFSQSGTYNIRVYAAWGCEISDLEVVI